MALIRKSKNRISKNLLLQAMSGHIGRTLVVKQYKTTTVFSAFPNMRRVKPTAKQQEKRLLFNEAVAHARAVLKDPKESARYARKLKG